MEQSSVNVIIADDYPAIRRRIRELLEKSPDIHIAGEAANGQEAVEMVEKFHPDVLILDLQMPVMDGFEAMEYLQKHGYRTRVLVVSAYKDRQYTAEVFLRGAWGYFLKEEAPEVILKAVRQAAESLVS